MDSRLLSASWVLIVNFVNVNGGMWQMWPELVKTAKEGGVDVIETYVFWNVHQPTSPSEVSGTTMSSHLAVKVPHFYLCSSILTLSISLVVIGKL